MADREDDDPDDRIYMLPASPDGPLVPHVRSWVYICLLPGGYEVIETTLMDDALADAVAAAGLPADLRWVTGGLVPLPPAPFVHHTVSGETFRVRGRNWRYDSAREGLKLNPVHELGMVPAPEGELRLELALPHVGWIDAAVIHGADSFEFSVSALFDPFRGDLVRWLERVARADEELVLEIDIEGTVVFFAATAAPHDAILVRIGDMELGQQVARLTFNYDRKAFVSAMYLALLRYWEHPDLRANWFGWGECREDTEMEELGDETIPYSIRSAMLDRFLLGST